MPQEPFETFAAHAEAMHAVVRHRVAKESIEPVLLREADILRSWFKASSSRPQPTRFKPGPLVHGILRTLDQQIHRALHMLADASVGRKGQDDCSRDLRFA